MALYRAIDYSGAYVCSKQLLDIGVGYTVLGAGDLERLGLHDRVGRWVSSHNHSTVV